MHILADFGKYTGHSRILADGQARGPGRVQVLAQRAQRLLCNGPRLAFIRAAHGGFHIGRELVVGRHAQRLYGGGDSARRDVPHSRATPDSRAARATASATACATRSSNAPGMM